jgi:hypothetical protein
MFICTFDREVSKEMDKKFKLIHSRMMNNKRMYVYAFDKDLYSKFDKKDKVFISKKLYF